MAMAMTLAACDGGVHLLPEETGVESGPLKSHELQLSLLEHQRNVDFVPEQSDVPVRYSLGGVDATFFAVDASAGLLTANMALDHESPQDADGDNVYELELQAWSRDGATFESATQLHLEVRDIPAAVQATLQQNADRTLTIAWTAAELDPDVEGFRLNHNSDGVSGFSPLDSNADGIVDSADDFSLATRQSPVLSALLANSIAAKQFMVESLDATAQVLANSNAVGTSALLPDELIHYLKAPISSGDLFGRAVALSADGAVLAVSAPNERGSGAGVDPVRDTATNGAGAVYVYRRQGNGWSAPVYIKASNPGAWDLFGTSVALSDDGSVLAVGSFRENGSGAGVDPAFDDALHMAGAVYVYHYEGGSWLDPTYIKAPNPSTGDRLGTDIALSGDGRTLIAGSLFEDGDGVGVNPAVNELTPDSGALYVYRFNGGAWQFSAYLKASNTGNWDNFSKGVAISADGLVIAVGADKEDGSGDGVSATDNNSANAAGAAYVFRYELGAWQQPVYIKASDSDSIDKFGGSVSLNSDGSVLVVGAVGEGGSGAGVDPLHDNVMASAGASYVYRYDGSNWGAPTYIKAVNPGAGDEFGHAVSLNHDATLLLVGAPLEDGAGLGLSALDNDGAIDAGAAYVYHYRAGSWSVPRYIKAPNTAAGEQFSQSITMSSDGHTVVIGADLENGAGTGLNPPEDKSAAGAGAVYLY